MKRNLLLALLICLALAVGSAATFWRNRAASAEDADLLPALIQACTDSVTSIKSGKGTVKVHKISYEYDGDNQKPLETDATYTIAFDGSKYRISGEVLYIKNEFAAERPVLPGTRLDVNQSFDGETLMRYEARLGTGKVGPVTVPELKDLHWSSTSMLIFPPSPLGYGANGHGVHRIDLHPEPSEDTIDKGLKVVRRESLKGRECIVVERRLERSMSDGKKRVYSLEYWVDPERGTVPRTQHWVEDSALDKRSLAGEINVEFRDYGNGVFGPAKYTHEYYTFDGKGGLRRVLNVCETTYETDFQLNVPIMPNDLTIALPKDANMHVVDAEGSPEQ